MKVSVCMITYNHEKYIEEAINGVLMQECNFEIELILANDCSPDKTDAVIQKILKTHPRASIIKYFKHEQNLGMMPNFIFALKQCKGKYVALCEGDDYWTDLLKLQKQVDFLEANGDYVLCFHNAEIIKNVKNRKNERRNFYKTYNKNDYTAKDVLNSWIIPTASMLFKNVISNFPLFFEDAVLGDLALQVYLCEYGKMRAMNDLMSVYRINNESITTRFNNNLDHNKKLIKQLKLMNSFFHRKYHNEIKRKIFLLNLESANYYKGKNMLMQLVMFLKAITLNPLLVFSFKKNVLNSFKAIGISFLVILKLKTL